MSLITAAFGNCGDSGGEDLVTTSRAYVGHENELDTNNFVQAHPNTVGTRLDDCQTCHRGGTFTYDRNGSTATATANPCDYCHLVLNPSPDYIEAQPTGYQQTLNPFGLAYLNAGRSRGALGDIAGDDSDGDGYDNATEIADLKYPGDDTSMPGQQVAPSVTFTFEQLTAMSTHTEFMLANANRQQYDFYANYAGVRVRDLLEAAGVDLADPNIQGITVVAPDGYMKDFTMAEVTAAYPQGLYYAGLDTATLGSDCGFVQYPDTLPDGLTDGGAIPGEQWLLIAYYRDGIEIEPSNLDITSGRINGEGPYRIIVPQTDPGAPDRGSNYPTNCNDGYDYDDSKDHNAGDMVRGVVAIRVNPVPEGYEDLDHRNGGWAYIAGRLLVVYGYGVDGE